MRCGPQAELETAIAAFVDPHGIPDACERDGEYERQQQVRQALNRLHAGALVKDGVTFEPLDYLDTRIEELTNRRDDAQVTLDALIQQAEQLLAVVTA